MPDIVIQAENLGKKYTIGHQAENGGDVALRDGLANNARNVVRLLVHDVEIEIEVA